MKPSLILLFVFVLLNHVFCQPYTVETVPNTKLINNSYVSNPDGILSDGAVATINSTLSDLEAKTTTQVAVVVLKSIGDVDHVVFAQQLFELWKIGRAKKDNGLLILMILEPHNIRFHTGFGLEGVLPDATCKRIQMDEMVPLFKIEEYDKGMIAGIDAVARVLTVPGYAEELRDESIKEKENWPLFFLWAGGIGILTLLIWYWVLSSGGYFLNSKPRKKDVPYPKMSQTKGQWITEFAVIPLGILILFNFIHVDHHLLYFLVALYGYAVLTLIHKRLRMTSTINQLVEKKDYFGVTEFFRHYQTFWLVMGILFAFPMLLYYFLYLSRKRYYRNYPRECKTCGKPLAKLDEAGDDTFLQKNQIFEEQLQSVDYDVWKCSSCNTTEVLTYINNYSKYDACPKCKTHAFYQASNRTVSAATYSSSGTGEKVHRCKFCSHAKVETYSIAQLTSSSSSSSSGSGSSSSSDSGGSWGGGDSGGGGASSSW